MSEDDKDSMPPSGVPPIDFNTFILSLSTSALIHLGVNPTGDESAKGPPVNLPLARQTIDLIAMLEEKTAGNLSGEEERLLSSILVDLRMRYVSASQG